MAKQIGRRKAIKIAAAGIATGAVVETTLSRAGAASERLRKLSTDPWAQTHDRVWLGEAFWANPMENWRVKNGFAECTSKGEGSCRQCRGGCSMWCMRHEVRCFAVLLCLAENQDKEKADKHIYPY